MKSEPALPYHFLPRAFGIVCAAASIALLALAPPVRAQAVPTAPVFTLSVSPQFPNAGEPVTVRVLPQNFVATSTVFTWFKNGSRLDAVSGPDRPAITLATDPEKAEIIQVRVSVAPGLNFTTAEQNTLITTIPGPAQLEQLTENAASDFSLEATDVNPDPGEVATVEVVTFAFDKDRANYEWRVNNVRQREASGRGQYRLAIPAGRESEARTVSVTLTTPDGITRTKSILIQTVSAPLYWWADTIVPYWYKGKALPIVGASVNVIVLPTVANPGGLAYQWRFNDGLIAQASGLGKSRYSFALQFPVDEQIEVTMKDAAGTFSKSAGITLTPVDPGVGIYAFVPKRGVVLERRAAEFSADSGQPHEFIAEPFFFSNASRLVYRWGLDVPDITGESPEPRRFRLTSTAQGPSYPHLTVAVEDPARSGIRANAKVDVTLR